jgi:hypothetical protein
MRKISKKRMEALKAEEGTRVLHKGRRNAATAAEPPPPLAQLPEAQVVQLLDTHDDDLFSLQETRRHGG